VTRARVSTAWPSGPMAARIVAVGLGAYLAAIAILVGILGFTNLWYGFFDLSDIPRYEATAQAIERGVLPYAHAPLEYPPLTIPLVVWPNLLDVPYRIAFAGEMMVLGALAAIAVALASASAWPGRERLVPPVVFAASVLAAGAIVANRLDMAVTLVVAVALLLLEIQWPLAAAIVLGLGFGLKLAPALLLPLVLFRSERPVRCALAFGIAAALPFLPFLSAPYLPDLFGYHLDRGLQVESVLATPLVVARSLGLVDLRAVQAPGSADFVGPGVASLARLSGPLMLAALALTWWLAWKARRAANVSAIAALATLLAILCSSKVLSPQFLVWTFPALALAAPAHLWISASVLAATALTQVEFPSLYFRFAWLEPGPVALVVARNLLLVGAFAGALVALRRMAVAGEPSPATTGLDAGAPEARASRRRRSR
jgi:hypothetical protein